MRIGLTCDIRTDDKDEKQAEFDAPATIGALCDSIRSLGHEVLTLGGARDLIESPEALGQAELVFNIAEGCLGRNREAEVPALLEIFEKPYVGSDPLALSLGLDKVWSKRLAASIGIETPKWICVSDASEIPSDLPFELPAIVKPRWEGSSAGVDRAAVVSSAKLLKERVSRITRIWKQPVLIERFIPGGELTVLMVGNAPPKAHPVIQRPIDSRSRLGFHALKEAPAKWEAPIELNSRLESSCKRIAVSMFEIIGCRDMARVDLRTDSAGNPAFIEINPLPSFDPEGSVGLLAEYLRISYTEIIGGILDSALKRLALNGVKAACAAAP